MKKYILIIAFILFPSGSFSQEENISEIIASIAEELADDETDTEAAELYTERLYDLIEKPVRINSAEESELSRLFFLTDFQVKALADYIHSSGRIYSIYEIASIPGFDPDLATNDLTISIPGFRSGTQLCFITSGKRFTIQLFTKVSVFRYIRAGSAMEIAYQI